MTDRLKYYYGEMWAYDYCSRCGIEFTFTPTSRLGHRAFCQKCQRYKRDPNRAERRRHAGGAPSYSPLDYRRGINDAATRREK